MLAKILMTVTLVIAIFIILSITVFADVFPNSNKVTWNSTSNITCEYLEQKYSIKVNEIKVSNDSIIIDFDNIKDVDLDIIDSELPGYYRGSK